MKFISMASEVLIAIINESDDEIVRVVAPFIERLVIIESFDVDDSQFSAKVSLVNYKESLNVNRLEIA